MSVFRKVSISSWTDPWFFGLSPDEKLTWLYLITSQSTTACGSYQINVDLSSALLHVDSDKLRYILDEFQKNGKIIYDKETNEIGILNWPKYNGSHSPKTMAAIKSSLSDVKSKKVLSSIQEVWIQYGYSIQAKKNQNQAVSRHDETGTREKEKEKEKEKDINPSTGGGDKNIIEDAISGVTRKYQEEVGALSPLTIQSLEDWINDFVNIGATPNGAEEVINEAIKTARMNNVRSMKYIESILRRFESSGVINGDQARHSNDEFASRKNKGKRYSQDDGVITGDVTSEDMLF